MTLELWTKTFSYELRDQMFQKGLTNGELAEMARISRQEVTKLLSGKHVPSLYVLNNLANALRISVSELTMFGESID